MQQFTAVRRVKGVLYWALLRLLEIPSLFLQIKKTLLKNVGDEKATSRRSSVNLALHR